MLFLPYRSTILSAYSVATIVGDCLSASRTTLMLLFSEVWCSHLVDGSLCVIAEMCITLSGYTSGYNSKQLGTNANSQVICHS